MVLVSDTPNLDTQYMVLLCVRLAVHHSPRVLRAQDEATRFDYGSMWYEMVDENVIVRPRT